MFDNFDDYLEIVKDSLFIAFEEGFLTEEQLHFFEDQVQYWFECAGEIRCGH